MAQIIGLEAEEATRFRARGLADPNGWLSRGATGRIGPERIFVIPPGVKKMRLESDTAGPSVIALDAHARA
jgi:hypothetical protein